MQAYCYNDKRNVELVKPKFEQNKLGHIIVKGTCPICGCQINKIIRAVES